MRSAESRPDRREKKPLLEHWQVIGLILIVYDAIAVNLGYFTALWLRFDLQYNSIMPYYLEAFARFAPIYTVLCIAVFALLRLYRSIWRFASFKELERILLATLITGVVHTVGISFLCRMPISYYLVGLILQFLLVAGIRFAYRFVLLLRDLRPSGTERLNRVMLIGAGSAGQLILRDLSRPDSRDKVCCIIDDNPNKWNRYIDGIPIVGGRDDILSACERYGVDKIFLAIPSAGETDKRDILNICKESGCQLKILPSVRQLLSDRPMTSNLKDVSIEDLLGRPPIEADLDEVFRFLTGKTILVTGGGGSIGSEICRQVASHRPKKLIIFDIYENNAYDIQLELREAYPRLDLVTLIGSVRDSRRIEQVFAEHRPDVVYHAAAHKHVPLMEGSPCEAIKNNVFGTYKTAYAAMLYGCSRFVLISTDKAVNPVNVMGASKRLCEMVVQTFDRKIRDGRADELPHVLFHGGARPAPLPEHPATEYVAVRFGNVLGSNGSVVPIFKRQIAKGGPVTVTHPDVIRYFMTVPEAVSLVLQAGVYAKGGEIFVLNMGSPVRIDTLARNLIKLSGLEPDTDIPIVYTGLRPGEKLYEEKLMAEEGMKKTPNKLIFVGSPIPFDEDAFLRSLPGLAAAAVSNDPDIRSRVAELVPTYEPAGEHGRAEKDETYERLLETEPEAAAMV